jgi:hypothetical protein
VVSDEVARSLLAHVGVDQADLVCSVCGERVDASKAGAFVVGAGRVAVVCDSAACLTAAVGGDREGGGKSCP